MYVFTCITESKTDAKHNVLNPLRLLFSLAVCLLGEFLLLTWQLRGSMLLVSLTALFLWPKRITANTYFSSNFCNFGVISLCINLFCKAKNCQITVVLIWDGCFSTAVFACVASLKESAVEFENQGHWSAFVEAPSEKLEFLFSFSNFRCKQNLKHDLTFSKFII